MWKPENPPLRRLSPSKWRRKKSKRRQRDRGELRQMLLGQGASTWNVRMEPGHIRKAPADGPRGAL